MAIKDEKATVAVKDNISKRLSIPNPAKSEKSNISRDRKRISGRPSSFDRTFNPYHQKIRRRLADALILSVDNSEKPPSPDVTALQSFESSSLSPSKNFVKVAGLFDGDILHNLFAEENLGNYVIVRKTGERQWEDMPIYARIGMHLLFFGPSAIRFVTWGWIRGILKDQSIREGKIYDSTDPKVVLPQIQSFIKTYSIDTSELLEPDLKKYPTFNSFFSRKLKPNARPAAMPKNPSIISSAADSRLTVWNTVDAAKKFWIKGRHFNIPLLLQDAQLTASLGEKPCLAIWRLAPQDYHRFHSPVSATVRSIKHIPGEYYTVNPQAINENLDVFTANTRSVAVLDVKLPGRKDEEAEAAEKEGGTVPVAFVAIGALLVGSIGWEKNAGQAVLRGENLGWFAYGGSTVIGVFPQQANIKWDQDLVDASETGIEVLVKAGERIGLAE